MTAESGPKLDLDSERPAREYEELSATRSTGTRSTGAR